MLPAISTITTEVAVAAAFLTLVLGGLGVALFQAEVGTAARRRRRTFQALAHTERARAAARRAAPDGQRLTALDIARLNAFRTRAQFMAGEPVEPLGWWGKLRVAWRRGYAGWIVAALIGAFSMATHFGAYWLIAGGGWPGAVAVTLLSTALMVAACAWIGFGLISEG